MFSQRARTSRWDDLPARSGPGSREEDAVDEHCQPDTYTVSRYFAI
jgi:hypothetical protein